MTQPLKSLAAVTVCLSATTGALAQVNISQLGGQDVKVITTTVPFLTITPDARAGAMGDMGVATMGDANSLHWNAAKLAFLEKDMNVSLNYTPWLRSLTPDISLGYLGFAKKINDRSGFGLALRYFSMGDISFTTDQNQFLKVVRPYEFSLDGGYAQKLSDKFSIGVAGRFIYSDLAQNTTLSNGSSTRPGYTFAGDISGLYRTKISSQTKENSLSFGFNISNLGGKISYSSASQRDFIPANLRLGGFYSIDIDEHNSFGIGLDINKLLVPSQPIYQVDSSGQPIRDVNGNFAIAKGKDPNVSTLAGAISSFSDAPNGFSEELKEIIPAIGAEYWYNKVFAVRAGYFYENKLKGNRQYATVGVGIRYSFASFDFSYLIPTSQTSLGISPLANTLRFSLGIALNQGGADAKK